ncbi:MAG: ABC transporter ATP-binding protein [Candidatus Omnitrophota bacterium]
MKIVELKNVWEKYRIKFIRARRVYWEDVWALKDINLSLEKGEVLGIIGQNGAGKTTLLKIIAGMFAPDKGEVDIRGKVATLMELGAGFNPEFTGRQNLIFNSRMYGLDDETLSRQIDKVIDFASLGKFIDAPVKFYSQGMYTRLAFALAIFVEPDILLIDDILAVGDEEARQKCIDKIFELKQAGKTIIVVSHDLNMVGKLCSRSIILENGRIIQEDSSDRVISYYLETVGVKSGIAILKKDKIKLVFNNGRMAINYSGYPITKGLGVYASFFRPHLNEWFVPNSLLWRIKSLSADEAIIEGSAIDGTLVQGWRIKLEDGYFNLVVELKERGEKLHADFILVSGYKKWLTLKNEGEFPVYADKTNWQDLDLEGCPKGTVALAADEADTPLPGIIFENKDGSNQLKVFNTGYEQEARVIQPYAGNNELLSLSLGLFFDNVKFNDYFSKLKQQFLADQQSDESASGKIRVLYTLASANMRLDADLKRKFIKVFYSDRELTKASGLHSGFLLNGIWYDTSTAQWSVDSKENAMWIRLSWKGLDFNEVWELKFEGQKLNWDMGIINNGTGGIPEIIKFGLFLDDNYQDFFCGHQEGAFPLAFKQWQDLALDNSGATLFGFKKTGLFPAVTIVNNDGLNCVIQNSDAKMGCRILQLSLSGGRFCGQAKEHHFKAQLNLLNDNNQIDAYLKSEREKIIASRTSYSAKARIFADPESRRIRIFYQDKEITGGYGLYATVFFSDEKIWFNSYDNDTQWEVEKISAEKLRLRITDKRLAYFSFDWELLLAEDDSLKIKISIETTKKCSLIYRDLRLEVADEYQGWKTVYEEGNFSARNYIHGLAPVRLKNNKVSGLILEPKDKNNLFNVSFYALSPAEKVVLSLAKRLASRNAYLGLNFSTVVPRNEQVVSPGKNIFFKAGVVLGKRIKLEEAWKDRVILTKQNLKLIFDRGRTAIAYKEKELTQDLGMYTSVCCGNVWYDSYQAVWNINKADANKISAMGSWPNVPILQFWRLELKGNDLIYWKVDMDVYGEVALGIEQVNIMLSSVYNSWLIPPLTRGKFMDEYTDAYDILPFRFWYGKSSEIIAKAPKLPKVSFRNNLKDSGLRAVIENTDNLYRARLLQFQKSKEVGYPGARKYRYFEGVIKIG